MTAAPAIEKHSPGTFCWVELATTDPTAARQFYTSLFGWGVEENPMGPDEVYTTWKVHGLEHGAMYRLDAERLSRGVPPHWLLYIAVKDVDAAAGRAQSLGASLIMPPTDVMEYGRMAVMADPQGAVIAIWQPKKHIGARIINTVGTLCWSELSTSDPAGAIKFYTSLFGWKSDTKKAGPPGKQTDYTEWIAGSAHIGGMMQTPPECGDLPPNWLPYFQVTDCIETVEAAKKLGAKVELGPLPIEGLGSFALIADPQGAHFYVFEMSLVA